MTAEQAVTVILRATEKYQSKICSCHPIRCSENAKFLIDTAKLGDRNDYKCDDLGVFKHNGVQHNYFSVKKNEQGNMKINRLKLRPSVLRKGLYDLKTSYWVHAEHRDFKRRSYELFYLWSDTTVQHVILQYEFDNDEHAISAVPHGASNAQKQYRRTKPSTKRMMEKKLSQGKRPSAVYDEVFEDSGGIIGLQSLGSVPRSRQEVKDVSRRRFGKTSGKGYDDMYHLVEKCKEDNEGKEPYLRRVVLAPEPMCVLASHNQLEDMTKFLTDGANPVVMGVDATFNLGNFLATLVTYKHPMLLERESGKSPVMLGPALLHVQRSVQSYGYLGQVITSLSPGLKNVQWIGTDRERAIFSGLQNSMPNAKRILCTKHIQDNVLRKLVKLGDGQSAKKAIMRDIFGSTSGAKGLIHECSTASFDRALERLESRWNEIEMSSKKTSEPRFYDYFCSHVADDMKSSMITTVRCSAGLDEDQFYYNNDNESMNAKIKRTVNYKRKTWTSFVGELRKIEMEQRRNIERAVFDEGPYRLKDSLSDLRVKSDDLCSMSQRTRVRKLKKFRAFKPNQHTAQVPQSEKEDQYENSDPPVRPQLGVDYRDFDLSPLIFDSMWNKAMQLKPGSQYRR